MSELFSSCALISMGECDAVVAAETAELRADLASCCAHYARLPGLEGTPAAAWPWKESKLRLAAEIFVMNRVLPACDVSGDVVVMTSIDPAVDPWWSRRALALERCSLQH